MTARELFVGKFTDALEGETFVKLTLSQPAEPDTDLRNLYARIVELKEGRRISLLYRHQRKDVTKNVTFGEAKALLGRILGAEWERAHLFTTTGDWQLKCDARGIGKIKAQRPTFTVAPPVEHDRPKENALSPEEAPWLEALGVTNQSGEPRPGMADKLRQIRRFVELLGHLVTESSLKEARTIRVVDMGAGKGYLTFATAQFFAKRGVAAEVIGVELRPELVETTNRIAQQCAVPGLRFEQGSIGDWKPAGNLDVLIALHACDTATDDALHQGLAAGASLLVAAPCCHKEIRAQMSSPPLLKEVLRHGILAEREAEILTDGIRAMLLEMHGFDARVFEFISPEHTSKNLMLAAHRRPRTDADSSRLRAVFRELIVQFNIREQRLARLLGELPQSPEA
jgi:SAM-dependent methyltransferase